MLFEVTVQLNLAQNLDKYWTFTKLNQISTLTETNKDKIWLLTKFEMTLK